MRKIALFTAIAAASVATSGCKEGKEQSPAPKEEAAPAKAVTPEAIAKFREDLKKVDSPGAAFQMALRAPNEELAAEAEKRADDLLLKKEAAPK